MLIRYKRGKKMYARTFCSRKAALAKLILLAALEKTDIVVVKVGETVG